jgi:hypothetical protein
MNKKKLALSILLLLFLVGACIIIPIILKGNAEKPDPNISETPPTETTAQTTTPVLVELTYKQFEDLEVLLAQEQIESLEQQLTSYISLYAPEHDTVTFIPEKTAYPNEYTLELSFLLSDNDNLSVYYNLRTDSFTFSEEQIMVEVKEDMTYEKPVDYTLPNYTTEEIERMQEGGFPDTESLTQSEEVIQ